MKITPVVGLALALIPVVYLAAPREKTFDVPAGLKDAPSGAQSDDFNTAGAQSIIDQTHRQRDAALAAEKGPASAGAYDNGKKIARQYFVVFAVLDLPEFRGDTAEDTKTNVERFFAGSGLKIAAYDDLARISWVKFMVERDPGVFGVILNQIRVESKLKDLPEVKELHDYQPSPRQTWTVELKKATYRGQVERIFSSLDFPHKIEYNNAPDSLQVQFEATSADPSSARQVLKMFPGKVKDASVHLRTEYVGGDADTQSWPGPAN